MLAEALETIDLFTIKRIRWLVRAGQMSHQVRDLQPVRRARIVREAISFPRFQTQTGHAGIDMNDDWKTFGVTEVYPAFYLLIGVKHRGQVSVAKRTLLPRLRPDHDVDLGRRALVSELKTFLYRGHEEMPTAFLKQTGRDRFDAEPLGIRFDYCAAFGGRRSLFQQAIISC